MSSYTHKYRLVDYFAETSNVHGYFGRVESGSSEVITTPWIDKDLSNEQKVAELKRILDDWFSHLEPLRKTYPGLFKFEEHLAEKVGPLSIMEPYKERVPKIEEYFTSVSDSEPIDSEAIKHTLNLFRDVRGIIPRSVVETVNNMKQSTNSGNPYFTRKSTVVSKTVPFQLHGSGSQLEALLNGTWWPQAAILGWRGQEGGLSVDDVKQRVVWMFPFAVSIAELQVYQPLIKAMQRRELVPGWVSQESVNRAVTRLFDSKDDKDIILCTDFTAFDQHFGPALQESARAILAGMLKDSSHWLANVFPIKYEIDLLATDNTLWRGNHGMGSGSGGTNFDETIAHKSLQYEVALRNHQILNPSSMCLGDDGILTYPGITVEDVIASYTAHGLEMNADKQEASTHECTYLRRWYSRDYRINGVCAGVYSTARAVGRLCMQERFYDPEDWGSKMVALRELSIIENCNAHPLFEEFADWCIKRDKYRLGLDIPGFLDNIEAEAKKATNLMPEFLGYTKSLQQTDPTRGIANWRIVKYLKSFQ